MASSQRQRNQRGFGESCLKPIIPPTHPREQLAAAETRPACPRASVPVLVKRRPDVPHATDTTKGIRPPPLCTHERPRWSVLTVDERVVVKRWKLQNHKITVASTKFPYGRFERSDRNNSYQFVLFIPRTIYTHLTEAKQPAHPLAEKSSNKGGETHSCVCRPGGCHR